MNFLKGFTVTLFSLIILIVFFLVYFDSDRLQIRNVKISSSIGFFPGGVDKEVNGLIKGNILFVDRVSLGEKIKRIDHDIENVDIVIYPPDTVSVDLIYREPIVRVVSKNGVNRFFDKDFNEVREYSNGIFSNVVVVFAEVWDESSLRRIASVISEMDVNIVNSKFFPRVFVVKGDGIYGMNQTYEITAFFGKDIDYDKLKKSFLVTKYIVQKNLPIKFVDARFDNIIGK